MLTEGPFYPLMLMPPLLWGGLLVTSTNFLRNLPNRSNPEFSFYAVLLVSWMGIVSLLGGFSIGLLVAGFSILIGVLSMALSPHYRAALIFSTTVSVLLLLSLRGWFLPAYYVLLVLLAGGLAYVAAYAFRKREDYKSQEFAEAILAILALLYFLSIVLSLMLDPHFVLPLLIAAIAVVTGIAWLATGQYYKGYAGFLSLAALVWLANLALYATTGN